MTQDDMSTVELAGALVEAIRVFKPEATPDELRGLVRDGFARGTLVKMRGQLEAFANKQPVSMEMKDATVVILRVEALDERARAEVEATAISLV